MQNRIRLYGLTAVTLLLTFSSSEAFGQVNLADVMKKLDDIDAKVSGINTRVEQNEQQTAQLQAELGGLAAKVNNLADIINNVAERQRSIILSTTSGDVLDISSQMEKPPFREALDSAVHQVLRGKQGTFTLTNKMPTYQRILVNRVEYMLRPGEVLSLKVSPGTVHTELAGEGAKTWMVGPPGYDEGVDIVPVTPENVAFYRASEPPAAAAPYVVQPAGAPIHTTARVVQPVEPTYVTSPTVPSPIIVGETVVYPTTPLTPIVNWR